MIPRALDQLNFYRYNSNGSAAFAVYQVTPYLAPFADCVVFSAGKVAGFMLPALPALVAGHNPMGFGSAKRREQCGG